MSEIGSEVKKSEKNASADPHPTEEKGRKAENVFVKYVYIPYISNIDTSAQTFSLRVDYDLFWRATDEDIKKWEGLGLDRSGYEPVGYKPRLVLQNASSMDKCDPVMQENGGMYTIQKVKELGNKQMNFVRMEVRATFIEAFNTDNFPFDTQQLVIPLCLSFQTADVRRFAPISPDGDIVYVLSEFNAIDEWKITSAHAKIYADSSNYPWCTTYIRVSRKPWNVVWKYFTLVSFLASGSLAGFSIKGRADRMGYLITLFLSIVAVQFSMNDSLPKSPRPSYADYIMVSGMTFTTALIVEAATFSENDMGELDDQRYWWIFGIIELLLHIFFVAWAILIRKRSCADNVRRRADCVTTTGKAKVFAEKLAPGDM
ncbi:hypothetical protein AAMO2058_000948300 [Amorphochlora amoebiformis]